jgi:sigma-B regulation protein RsbU (phosphoserine phosphatase)
LKEETGLLLLTDGTFEAKDKTGKRLGFDNLVRFVEANKTEKGLLNLITDYIDHFSEAAARSDDVTVVELRWG